MLNLKKFKITQPPALLKSHLSGPMGDTIFLESEEGREWYSAQSQFQKDTVKISYDADGVIRQIVNKADASGNYDVSLLVPINLSVAEIAVADSPEGMILDGTWKFDEDSQSVYQDADAVASRTLAKNTLEYNSRLRACTDLAFPLQSAVMLGVATDKQQEDLAALQQYAVDLMAVDLTANPASFPVAPFPTV